MAVLQAFFRFVVQFLKLRKILFNVVAHGDGDGGAGSGIRTRVTSLEGWCINPYTMPA